MIFRTKTRLLAAVAVIGLAGSIHQSSHAPFGVAFSPVATAHAAQDIAIDSLTAMVSGVTLTFKNLRIVGSNIDKPAVEALFKETDPEKLQKLWAAFSAQSINADEVTVSYGQLSADGNDKPSISSTQTMRNYVMRTIANGRAASAEFDSMKGTSVTRTGNAPPQTIEITYGHQSLSDLDLLLAIRYLLTTAVPEKTELQPLMRNVVLDSIAMEGEAAGPDGHSRGKYKFSAGRVSIPVTMVRPFEYQPYISILNAEFLAKLKQSDNLHSAEGFRTLFAFYADILSSQSFEVDMSDLRMSMSIPTGKAAGLGGITMTIKRLKAIPGNWGTEGFDFKVSIPEGNKSFCFGMDTLGGSGGSLEPTLQGLRNVLKSENLDVAFKDKANILRLIPKIGTLSMTGMSVSDCTAGAATILTNLKSFELAIPEQTNGIPTTAKLTLSDLFVPETVFASTPPGQDLNLKELKLSALIDYAWNKASGDLAINHVDASVAGLGTAKLSAQFGNIQELLFSGSDNAAFALIAATAKSLNLSIDDNGGIDRIMAMGANDEDLPVEDYRSGMIETVTGSIGMLTGGKASGTNLAKAIAAFLQTPGHIEIGIKSKRPNGLGMADFAAAQKNPAALLDKVDLTATSR